ncbi:MAG: hypothetical protein IJS59_05620 [Bacteroidaceae bacterium]|nr:hypothetical protein [Bacteroidaceae bacterium]
MKHTTTYTAIAIAAIVALAACTGEGTETTPRHAATMTLVAAAPALADVGSDTRAAFPPDGFYAYSAAVGGQFVNQMTNDRATIAAFFTQSPTAQAHATFAYDDATGRWSSTYTEMQTAAYYLYGFIPAEDAATATITAPSGNFANGATLTLTGLNTVTPSDVCVAVAAREGTAAGVEGLQAGRFLFNANAAGSGSNYIYLLFDHIYSSVRLSFRVDATYAALRTIRLRKLEMQAYSNNAAVSATASATITLEANATGTSPITALTITPDATGAEAWATLYAPATPLTLATTPSDFIGCFAAALCDELRLRTTYDVLDTAGTIIRHGCVAENAIHLSTLLRTQLTRGHIYTVNLTVNPTYLYVLSDPDLDNPTISFL